MNCVKQVLRVFVAPILHGARDQHAARLLASFGQSALAQPLVGFVQRRTIPIGVLNLKKRERAVKVLRKHNSELIAGRI